MKKVTVTGEIRSILQGLKIKYTDVFSDKYGVNRVGVKFCKVVLTENEKQIVREEMEGRGFTFHFIRENNGEIGRLNYFKGTRFCFTKN
jgi:hypothetical protein